MAIKFDDKARRVSLSVRDLVNLAHPVGTRGSLWMRLGALTAGQWAHREHQARQAELEIGYRSETAVSGEIVVRGYTVNLKGRVDGLRRQGETLVVEEIKSFFAPSSRLASVSAEELEPFMRQLQVYAYLLGGGEAAVRGELALVSLLDHKSTVLAVECDMSSTRRFMETVLDDLVRRRLDYLERMRLRRAVGAIPFAHETLRPQQVELIDALRRSLSEGRTAMVSAPAGVGKTAAALAAALEVAYASDKRLFFLTSKTPQQRMAADTLSAMHRRGLPLRAVVLAAREKMCLSEERVCDERLCPFAGGFFRRAAESGAVQKILEPGVARPQDVRRLGLETVLCPFELSLQAAEEADCVVCDFNYVFHPTVALERFFGEKRGSESIVIIDEAHNLYGRAMDYFSPELASGAVRSAAGQLESHGSTAAKSLAEELLSFERSLTDLAERRGFDGSFMETSFETAQLAERKEKLDWAVFGYLGERARTGAGSPVEDSAYELYHVITDFVSVASTSGEESSHVIKPAPDGPVFKVLCKDPSARLAQRMSELAGIVAMSATIEPMEFFRDVLGFSREATDFVRVGSPFKPENRLVVLASWVDTRYRRRSASYPVVAEIIHDMVRCHSGHYMVFAPSFAYAETLSEFIDGRLEIILEKPAAKDRDRAAIFERLASPGDGSLVVLAVAGGALAEGVDYPGRMCEGVVVAGPALPKVEPERELIRAYYDERGVDGFSYAYIFPGMNRVVQSAGRLIRSADDRGVLVLADRRFAEHSYRRLMPPDWETSIVSPHPDDFTQIVKEFWQNAR